MYVHDSLNFNVKSGDFSHWDRHCETACASATLSTPSSKTQALYSGTHFKGLSADELLDPSTCPVEHVPFTRLAFFHCEVAHRDRDRGDVASQSRGRTDGGDALINEVREGSNSLGHEPAGTNSSADKLARHNARSCRPCVFLKNGCRDGESCSFCHVPHTRRSMPKLGKEKRMRIRKMMSRTQQEAADPTCLAGARQVHQSPLVVQISL
mmetsp:Transcript_45374/g.120335  ORF Transcript_45374/g.120335 Transcript_45374/m.120335 type:complete len:210 (-) Transcript_45374:37-666(-)